MLWAGVPLLTVPGLAMAQRVAASIALSSGLSALVARSLEDYATLAHRLAESAAALQHVRARVRERRAGGWRLTDVGGWAIEARRLFAQV